MLAQMLGDEARPEIDSSSRACADDDLDSFAFEVRLSQSPVSATNKLCGGQNHQAKRVNICYQRFFHTQLSSSFLYRWILASSTRAWDELDRKPMGLMSTAAILPLSSTARSDNRKRASVNGSSATDFCSIGKALSEDSISSASAVVSGASPSA